MTDEYGVIALKEIPVVSSRKIAKKFGKRHKNVLRNIENLKISTFKIEPSNNSAKEFSKLNFIESTYKSRGKKYPEYLLTKDSFTLLVMGFTGSKALEFKLEYIARFNDMSEFIKSLQLAKLEFPAFTKAITQAHEEPQNYHYSNEINMINRIILGKSSKEFKISKGLDPKKIKSIRPYLKPEQIKAVETLQRVDIGLMIALPDFHQRKEALLNYYTKMIFVQKLLIGNNEKV